VTNDECKWVYDASDSYSYSYSFSYGDLDEYAKWGCPDIPEVDVEATTMIYYGDDTCNDADDNMKGYQVWPKGCFLLSEPDASVKYSVKASCDANDGFRLETYQNVDCTGTPAATEDTLATDTCTSDGPNSLKVICGCAVGVGCSPPVPTAAPTVKSKVVDAAAARGPLLATAVLGAAAAAL